MSRTFAIRGLTPRDAQFRLRQTVAGVDGPWTDTFTVSPGSYKAPLSADLMAKIEPFLPVALGGTGANVPDLSAIGVTVSAGVIPRKSGVAFQLVSGDANFYAFAMFGTAKWTFSQNAGENYVFDALAGKLAGDTAGTAFGPYVGHVYLTGPGTGVATPLAHQWSVTLSYPGLPDRTITWEDGAKDLLASIQAGSDVTCNAILVHDDDHWYDGRTVWWSPDYASAQAFYDAMALLEENPTSSSGVYDWGSRTVADFKVGTLAAETAVLRTASAALPIRAGWRMLIRAGTTATFSTAADDKITVDNIRIDRFGTGLNPIIDASGHTTDQSEMIKLVNSGDLLNLTLVGPYDAETPGTSPAMQYSTIGIAAPDLDNEWSDGTIFRCDVSGVSNCFYKVKGGARTVIADCHFHNWYNYGMFPGSMFESAFVGLRVAQKATARQLGRIYKDGGGGNSNQSLRDQQEARDAFDWGLLTGPIATEESIFGLVPESIPAGYDPWDYDAIRNDPMSTWTWGTHPYDTANGGTAAWDWFVLYHSGIDLPGLKTVQVGGEPIMKNAFNNSYHKCALHGPLRTDVTCARFGMHQIEFISRNGWSPLQFDRTLSDPVTGRYDIAQTNPKAFDIQATARMWTAGRDSENLAGTYAPSEMGLSVWRAHIDGAVFGILLQNGGISSRAFDKTVPHSGVIFDGLVCENGANIRTGYTRAATRNSLIIARDDDPSSNPYTSFSLDSNNAGYDNEGTPQTPNYFYNCTAIYAGDKPNGPVRFFTDPTPSAVPSEPYASDGSGVRQAISWNNVEIMAGSAQSVTFSEPKHSFLGHTTATLGTEAFGYAPTAGSSMIGATVQPHPIYDLEGVARNPLATAGAFEVTTAVFQPMVTVADAPLAHGTAMTPIDCGALLPGGAPYFLVPEYDALVEGVSLDTATGVLSGTPTDRRGRGWHYIRVADRWHNTVQVRMCSAPDLVAANYDHVYDGTTITAKTTLQSITGDVLIINANIDRELTLRNLTGGIVTVANCDVDCTTLGDNGLVLSGSVGDVENCTIWNCDIVASANGILASRGVATHPGLRLLNSRIRDTGAAGGPDNLHGVYCQVEALLEGNNIGPDADDPTAAGSQWGSGISHRSSGTIRANRIRTTYKDGIGYFADHPASGRLTVEQNDIDGANTSNGADRYAINFLGEVAGATAANFITGGSIRNNALNGGVTTVSADFASNAVVVTVENNV